VNRVSGTETALPSRQTVLEGDEDISSILSIPVVHPSPRCLELNSDILSTPDIMIKEPLLGIMQEAMEFLSH
jgi:hypothetical protein